MKTWQPATLLQIDPASEWCLRNAGQCYSSADDPNPRQESEVTQQGEDESAARPLDPEPHPEALEDESAAATAGVASAASAAILATLPLLFIR